MKERQPRRNHPRRAFGFAWLFFGFGFATVAGVVVAGVVVVVGVVVFGAVVVVEAGAVVAGLAAPGAVPAPLPTPVELPEAGFVDVAGPAGSVVIGVGTGGSGFDITLAIISVKPASDLLRNL